MVVAGVGGVEVWRNVDGNLSEQKAEVRMIYGFDGVSLIVTNEWVMVNLTFGIDLVNMSQIKSHYQIVLSAC